MCSLMLCVNVYRIDVTCSILGLRKDCSDEDIRKYYRRQAVLVHPDKVCCIQYTAGLEKKPVFYLDYLQGFV